MPRTIDELFEALVEPEAPPVRVPGEETLTAGPEKGLWDYIAPFLPFYRQVTGEVPWRSPETAMEAIGWGMGGLMRGPGMAKAAAPRGASAVREALSEIGGRVLGKRGVPATIPEGPLPAFAERGFTRVTPETVDVSPVAETIRGRLPGIPGRKLLPQMAGPSAPAIPLRRPAYTTGTKIERQAEDIQYVIEDLLRESLRAKGFIE